ncbi:MAG: hypothetical protein WCI43_04775 [Candidatus Firestonebacteria bacterium]
MKLEFKPDFPESKARWDTFWKNRNKRPLVSIVIPKEGVTPVEKPLYMAGHDGNFAPVIEQVYKWAGTHEFIGDALPFYQVEFGPDHFSTFLGADMEYAKESNSTSWAIPFVSDWDKVDLQFRKDSAWWEKTVKFIKALRKNLDGKVLIAAPTLVAGMDCLAAIRGVQNLLMDTVEYPEKVKRALDAQWLVYEEVADELFKELGQQSIGSVNRHGMYSSGKLAIPQCDFSCMISPEMYNEFVSPFVEKETQYLDSSEYHLDGPGALVHLERICSFKKLGVIQWVPGAGEAGGKDWTELYKKIDQFGKGMIIHETPEYFKKLLPQLNTRQLFLKTDAKDRIEAESIYRELTGL